MDELVFICSIVLFIATIVVTNRYFFRLSMNMTARRFEKKFGYALDSINFSYEQMVYLVKLPSNSPVFKEAKKEDIGIDYDYASFMYPIIKGVSIYLHRKNEKITLAYLPIEKYRSPLLDKLLKEGSIDQQIYRKISTCKIFQPKITKLIIEEVYRKLQVGRYNNIKK